VFVRDGCYSLSELKINYILSLTVSPRGASSSARAWASPKAGVLPSFAPSLGRFTPVTGIEVDRIRIAQVHKERREGEEGAANACVRLLACEERVSPGDHMRASDDPKLFGPWMPTNRMKSCTLRRYARRVFSFRMLANHSMAGGTSESRWNSAARERTSALLDDQGLVMVFVPFVFRQAFIHDRKRLSGAQQKGPDQEIFSGSSSTPRIAPGSVIALVSRLCRKSSEYVTEKM